MGVLFLGVTYHRDGTPLFPETTIPQLLNPKPKALNPKPSSAGTAKRSSRLSDVPRDGSAASSTSRVEESVV